MEAPDNEVDALRAEVLRLKELMAVNDQLRAAKDEIIAVKMEVVACKEALLSRTAEELQQCKFASRSKRSKLAAAADNRIEQPCVLARALGGGGSVLLLEWLHTVTEPWPAIHKSKMLARAGWNNHLAVVKWLIAKGAEWPPKFAGHSGDHGAGVCQ
eukprot:723-Heterococcus_DN1.PRE.1